MAATVTWEDLRALASFRAGKGCVVSLYLNLDPHVVPTAVETHTRINSLLDEAAKQAESNRFDLTHDQRVALRADLDRIRRYVEFEFDRDGTRGLAVFSASLDNFWWPVPLSAPVPDDVKINQNFYLTPLVPLVGRGEGALVAVVGRERGDLYRLRAGRLEEVGSWSEEQPRRHDQGGWSQARLQRHADELAHAHLRRVAEELDRRLRRERSARVVIVSSEETRAELAGMLSSQARAAVVGWTHAEAHAAGPALLELTLPVLERWQAEREAELVERWRDETGRNGRAAAGWAETLEAASDGRIEILLCRQGPGRRAWRCPACGRLAVQGGKCPLDGNELEPRDEGLELAVHQTLAHGGTVWSMVDRPELDAAEGIGALLRY
jgi:peptide chain release factor subunit 1